MKKKNAHQNKITYALFNGKTTPNKPDAMKERQDYVLNFPVMWHDSDADTRLAMVRYAGELPPEQGIGLVLYGMQDYTRSVKLETRKILKTLADKITIRKGRIISPKTAIKSELFARRIHREMSQTISLDELTTYISILLEINGRGPFFAWKFFIKGTLPPNIFIDTINTLPEYLRLRFVSYYFRSEISEKRKRAGAIRMILKSISEIETAARFIEDIIENAPNCRHAGIALGGTILTDFMNRLDISTAILKSEFISKDEQEVITCLKIAGIMRSPGSLYRFLPLLDKSEPRRIRLACIDVLGKSHNNRDSRITSALTTILDDDESGIVINAFKALIRLNIFNLVDVTCALIDKNNALRVKVYKCLSSMKAEDIIAVLDKLPEPFSTDARRTVGKLFIRKNPERLKVILEYHKNSSDSHAREAAQNLYNKIQHIKNAGCTNIRERFTPEPLLESTHLKKLLKKQSEIKQKKKLFDLALKNPEDEMRLPGEIFHQIKIEGLSIENANLTGSIFLNTDLSAIYLTNVSLKGSRFENVSFKNAVFRNVIFDESVFLNTDAHAAHFIDCSFSGASIAGSSFEFAEMAGASFTGAVIIDSVFSKSELSFASFTGAQLYMSSFKYSSMFQAEFVYTKALLCDFSETNLNETANSEQSKLNAPLRGWNSIEIPAVFYEKSLLETRWLNILILTNEMDRQRTTFLNYNKRRKECALDAFKADQEDLFEIIPLLIHLSQHLVPVEKKPNNASLYDNSSLKNLSSGIYGYVPPQKTVSLAKKYLKCDKLLLVPGKKNNIEAVYTIGSLGTIAQSSDSDIDYWVCINRNTMDEDAVSLLKLKLEAIEKWAKSRFGTELHFFVVDASSIREGRFGGSDFESSGSAQGMILKEEFYRTMILIAGKIPFWCVLPVWAADKYYSLLYLIANRFHNDYLDFGNVSAIPSGEYFGASMWQLFKSLTSPYKSVMKMGLLEKSIQEKEERDLLCNRLKKRWAGGKCDLRHQDPYLILFEEIMSFYSRTEQQNLQSLVQICFFFKLGIRSMKDLDRSVMKIRQILVRQCIENFAWNESMLCELGCFDEWSFEKIKNFSESINHFMLETYRKLSMALNGSADSKAVITGRDITILGRKMFVYFVPQPFKVSQLPNLTSGRSLFKQLYLYYRQAPKQQPVWEVYSRYNKNEMLKGNEKAVLGNQTYIEEIAAWVIRNNLVKTGTQFTILPNPTPVTAQEFNELLTEMGIFFDTDSKMPVSSTDFLEPYQIKSLYIIINFNTNQKADKIFRYIACFTTTWGDFFCRPFHSKQGLNSIADAEAAISRDLDLSLQETHIGYYIPKMSRKRIKKV